MGGFYVIKRGRVKREGGKEYKESKEVREVREVREIREIREVREVGGLWKVPC